MGAFPRPNKDDPVRGMAPGWKIIWVCYHKSWRLHAIYMEWWLIYLAVCVLLLELLVSTMSFIPHYW